MVRLGDNADRRALSRKTPRSNKIGQRKIGQSFSLIEVAIKGRARQ
jgi:hypothetical protein